MVTMTAQESLGVARISLSVTTMDDVFLKIGEMTDAKVSLPATIQANYSEGGIFSPTVTDCIGLFSGCWGGRRRRRRRRRGRCSSCLDIRP